MGFFVIGFVYLNQPMASTMSIIKDFITVITICTIKQYFCINIEIITPFPIN